MGLRRALACFVVAGALGDGYGDGMGKSTYAASDPLACFNFFDEFLPIRCQDPPSFGFCNSTGECYTSGRASLCDAGDIAPEGGSCSYPASSLGDFGLHAVNVSSRPGFASISEAEALFEARWREALATRKPNALLDFTTMLFAPILQTYVDALDAAGVAHFLIGPWKDDEGTPRWSLLARACGMILLELVSDAPPSPKSHTVPLVDALARLPASVFEALNTSTQDPRVLQPLGVSKAASDLDAVDAFYAGPMRATLRHRATHGKAEIVAYKLHNAEALVRFVRRSDHDPAVLRLEGLKKAAREAYHVDAYCGVDKWYDNHYDYVQYLIPLDALVAAFEAFGAKYHVFGNGTVPYNVYVGDPTGDSIQLVGDWRTPPVLARGDALTDACTQGNCARFNATATCAADLSRDETLRAARTNCTDALYDEARWAALLAAGCTNADVVNFCVPEEEAAGS